MAIGYPTTDNIIMTLTVFLWPSILALLVLFYGIKKENQKIITSGKNMVIIGFGYAVLLKFLITTCILPCFL